MTARYIAPELLIVAFHCPNCGVYASQSWFTVWTGGSAQYNLANLRASRCAHCTQHAIWFDERMIVPAAVPVERAHTDLPAECAADYEEARQVFGASPRASAALLRLCIQKLMPHLGEAGKNINDDIASLVSKGLSPVVQQALDVCRVVGNNAVHPGEIDIQDSPEVARQLFGLINFVVEDRLTRPKQVAAMYAALPDGARAAVEKRDAAK